MLSVPPKAGGNVPRISASLARSSGFFRNKVIASRFITTMHNLLRYQVRQRWSHGQVGATGMRRNGPLRRGQKEGELRIFRVIRLQRRDQRGSTHIPTRRSASSTDAFPRKVDGFLTRFAI